MIDTYMPIIQLPLRNGAQYGFDVTNRYQKNLNKNKKFHVTYFPMSLQYQYTLTQTLRNNILCYIGQKF